MCLKQLSQIIFEENGTDFIFDLASQIQNTLSFCLSSFTCKKKKGFHKLNIKLLAKMNETTTVSK